MAKRIEGTSPTALHVRQAALGLPKVEQGIACEGTAVESRTFKLNGKAFLFLRPGVAMLKLRESLLEAASMAGKEPGRYRVGSGGWVTVTYGADDAGPPRKMMERWIAESHGLYESQATGKAKKPVAKKRAAKKRAGKR